MKRMWKTLAVLLALAMALSTAAFAADSFSDVPADAYYADAVLWAAEEAITTGYGDATFRPERTVTRAEAVTFLWRMAGEPAPTQEETFDDVENDPNNAWYKTAVQWAVENGITNGTGSGFSPTVPCSRGMILTMLYRMEGCPFDAALAADVPENSEDWTLTDLGNWMVQALVHGFRTGYVTDIKEGAWYELAIIWANSNGILGENQVITEGEGDGMKLTIQPGTPCRRGEMVSFLYQASGDAPLEGAVKTGKIP